jgi:nitrogen fixation protein NifZ
MLPRYEYGEAVRVVRHVRNDGTFPGRNTGDLLVRRGSIGYVKDVGTFLQDQLIYSVDFVEEGLLVGCREEELILATEAWQPSRFEVRDKVCAHMSLALQGKIVVTAGQSGEVLRVVRDAPGGVAYHVYFGGRDHDLNGRILQVPENALQPVNTEASV